MFPHFSKTWFLIKVIYRCKKLTWRKRDNSTVTYLCIALASEYTMHCIAENKAFEAKGTFRNGTCIQQLVDNLHYFLPSNKTLLALEPCSPCVCLNDGNDRFHNRQCRDRILEQPFIENLIMTPHLVSKLSIINLMSALFSRSQFRKHKSIRAE